MNKIFFLGATAVLLFATSCKTDNKKLNKDDAKPMTNEEILEKASTSKNINVGDKVYLVDIPNGWTTKDTSINNLKFYFLVAPTSDADFRTNINIINESMQGISFDEYKKKTIESMKHYMPNVEILESGDMKASDLAGSWFHYNLTQSGIKLGIINYTFPKDGIAYIITATTKAENLDKYRITFDAVAKSFHLKN